MKAGILLLSLAAVIKANNWETYPEVPKTASINGFADPIIDDLPKCARDCVKASTGNTPCPYWDTGCLCVMPQWSGLVAQCIAEECEGKEVVSATSLAYELCSSVGANIWLMPASITAALTSAAGSANVAAPTPTETGWDTLLDDEDQAAAKSIASELQDSDSDSETGSAEAEETEASTSGGSSASDSSESDDESEETDESSTSSDFAMRLSIGSFTFVFGSLVTFLI